MVKVKAVFSYAAEQEDELNLEVGDIITDIKKQDGGWWEGELNGKRGVFPESFVEEIIVDGITQEKPVSSANKKVRRVKVAFSYVAEENDELSLEVGDFIDVTKEIDPGWWEGFLRGKKGVFPSNFVEVVTEDDEEDAGKQKHEEHMDEELPTLPIEDDEPPKPPEPEKPKPVGMGFGMGLALTPDDLKRQLKKVSAGDAKKPPAEPKLPEPLHPLKSSSLTGSGKRSAPGPPGPPVPPGNREKDEPSVDKEAPKKPMVPPGMSGPKEPPLATVRPLQPQTTPLKAQPADIKNPPPPVGGKSKPPPPPHPKPKDSQQNGLSRAGSIGIKGPPPPPSSRSGSINKRPVATPVKPPPPSEKKVQPISNTEPKSSPAVNESPPAQHVGIDLDCIAASDVLTNPVKSRAKGPAKNLPARYSHIKDDEPAVEDKHVPPEPSLSKSKPKPAAPVIDEKVSKDIGMLKKDMESLREQMAAMESKFLKHIKVLTEDLDAERKQVAGQKIEIDRLKKQVDILMK